ncbi:MAG: hypothetical protein KJO98_01785 [Rhodothermia bacterium]|nr:hypothetical protein [Rhodothermia bacterium]
MACHFGRFLATAYVAAFAAACQLVGSDGVAGGAAVIFITQVEPQADVMQALYEGKVSRKGDCIVLSDSPEEHTVVWPHGFRLSGSASDVVLDDEGRLVGRIGDGFRLGGGEVPTLWEGGPVSEHSRRIALEECPGLYWIVGEILQ